MRLTRIATGLARLDEFLGGGLPHGLTLLTGADASDLRLTIAKQKRPNWDVPGGQTDRIDLFLDWVSRRVDASSHNSIIDLGDVTRLCMRTMPTEGVALIRALDSLASQAKPVALLMETQQSTDTETFQSWIAWFSLWLHGDTPSGWHNRYNTKESATALPFNPYPDRSPEPEAPSPMTAERILAALAKDPNLLYQVASRIKVLGPWVSHKKEGTRGRWVRAYAPNSSLNVYYVHQYPDDSWRVFGDEDGEAHASREDAQRSHDDILRMEGFTLLDVIPGEVIPDEDE